MSAHDGTGRARRDWLSILALGLAGLLYLPSYLAALLPALAQRLDLWPLLQGPAAMALLLPLLPRLALFAGLGGYLSLSLATLAVAGAALVWGRPRRGVAALLALALVAMLAFPWLERYRPAVGPATGYRLQVATAPGLLAGVVKRAQVAREERPCTYTLLGWSDAGVLYYQAQCGQAPPALRAYDPRGGSTAGSAMPERLWQQSPDVSPLEQVRAFVYPPSLEPSLRRLALQGPALASPDGGYTAVVARHVYGPEDVIVLSRAP